MPEPELKETSQKLVELSSIGLYLDQAPEFIWPYAKTGFSFKTDLVTSIVAPREGLTSVFDKPKRSGKTLPIKPQP